MCGIGGFLQVGGLAVEAARGDLSAMAAALEHRGPDAEGLWLDAPAGIAFCHRRLAIVDLSPLGAQPMRSASGRFTITFNGEIYNYRALRAQLIACGAAFRGGSDTEVLLAAVEEWGVTGALQRSRGMFALGLWDAQTRTLWLARDRFGEKPLYYADFSGADFSGGHSRATLVFGSELKALRRHSAWRGTIDRNALAAFLRYDFIPAPQSIFQGVRKLRPGCTLKVSVAEGGLRMEEQSYWTPESSADAGSGHGIASEGEALERVDAALQEAVRLAMVADVPLGAFLSGGIDSSLIVALMQQASSQPVRTFSIGFEEEPFNEAPHARRVASHLGTQHTELIVTSADALEVIPRLAQIYDEPFADSSQIPTFLVSELARKDVTVALSGDAGDELFGGYSRYLDSRNRWNRVRGTPAPLRHLAARTLESMPSWAFSAITAPMRAASHWRGRQQVAERMRERAKVWGARSVAELYDASITYWQPSARLVVGADEIAANALDRKAQAADPVAQMMRADIGRYLPDDILVKVDRAAMAVSLETRVPLLDHLVAEVAWDIPTSIHLKDGRGKWILRQLLERRVPREMFERPKSGFAVPVERWLRGELRDWAGALLEPARLRREGFLRPEPIATRWRQHLRGEMNWSSHLWGVLMFESWLDDFNRVLPPSSLRPAAIPAGLSVASVVR